MQQVLSESTISVLSGTLGGMAQVLVGHPFDTIKVRLQTKEVKAIDCLKNTLKLEGLSGFYRGIASPLVGIGLW